jgi:hypothetical protein
MNQLFSDALDALLLHQALANPSKSAELRDFVQDVFRSESQPLFREQIQMQHARILQLSEEIQRLQTAQLHAHAEHAAHTQTLHADHTAQIQALHAAYTQKLVDAHYALHR